ncbi:hypothetical protein MC885_005929 [Smutsia gigantea]|nr:hypothetical protein MC885_005929 [Smutsia gigantea]
MTLGMCGRPQHADSSGQNTRPFGRALQRGPPWRETVPGWEVGRNTCHAYHPFDVFSRKEEEYLTYSVREGRHTWQYTPKNPNGPGLVAFPTLLWSGLLEKEK